MENVIQLPRQRKRKQIAPDISTRIRRSAAWREKATLPYWYRANLSEFLDTRIAEHLSPSEQAVVRFAFRRTVGFLKEWEAIPYRHFVEGFRDKNGKLVTCGCGLKERTVKAVVKKLVQDGVLISRPVFRHGVNLIEYRLPLLDEFRDLPRFAAADLSFTLRWKDDADTSWKDVI